MSDTICIGIVEDEKLTRAGLAALVHGAPGFAVTGAWRSVEEALPALGAKPPDVLLLDIQLPGASGIDGVRLFKAAHPQLQILMLTVYADNEHVFAAICAGACGYLLKDTPPERLLEALREVHGGGAPMSPEIARQVVELLQRTLPPRSGEPGLSARETEVLRLLADGHSYKTAAHALGLSADTIRFHVRHIYEKLHVHSKSEAVLKAFRGGWLG
jgi:DNA-binding NarL/FixJ family response regulator